MLAHDPLAYRSLLLRLAQSGTAALPMGDLRFLAAYARCVMSCWVCAVAVAVAACSWISCISSALHSISRG
jgi:hypothetical protein